MDLVLEDVTQLPNAHSTDTVRHRSPTAGAGVRQDALCSSEGGVAAQPHVGATTHRYATHSASPTRSTAISTPRRTASTFKELLRTFV